MKRLRVLSLLSIALVLAFVFGTLSAACADEQPATTPLLVKLVDGLDPAGTTAVIAANGGAEISSVPALRLHVISVPAADLPATLQKYQADARVQTVEMDTVRKADGMPGDPGYGVQWAWPKIGWESVYGTVAPGGSAKVAIVDTGIDASHPELAGAVIPGRSILDGTNGLSDPNGHGTSLAGIVAAMADNGQGIAGIGYAGVRIMPVVALGANGMGQDSDIIAAIVWAADQGADVILMGFSNPDFSRNLQDAIDYAWSKGAVLVAAAGNSGVGTPTFPAGDRGVVGVSATDRDDTLASGSNYGQDVFLAAPGTGIYTTMPGNGYSSISGTSASSAIVAGVAAFMKAVDPSLTNGVIVGRLGRSADYAGVVGDPNNQAMFGNGRVNMANALADTSTVAVQPAGAAPVGAGGPYIGPYTAATKLLEFVFAGTGGGTLSFSDFNSILTPCTQSCNKTVDNWDVGTITVEPDQNSVFAGWSSTYLLDTTTCMGTTTPCTISIKDNGHRLDVLFNLRPVISGMTPTSKTFGDSGFAMTLTGTYFVSGATVRFNGVNLPTTFVSSTELQAVVPDSAMSAAGTFDVTVVNPDGGISDPQRFTVLKATPVVTWARPADITYGTPLGGTQLAATASVPGTFSYDPPAGTVLNAGTNQSLSVTFTPADAANYTTATATAEITAVRATPVISWSNPAAMIYGMELGAAQLSATAAIPGTFAYTPAAGTILAVGDNQTLSVTFHPTDIMNYTTATASVTVNVVRATPVITWGNPADISYGTLLGGQQLNAAASVPGTFTYTPPAGTLLAAGHGQTLTVTFTPAEPASYNSATATVTINVAKATPVTTWANPADISYGTPLSGTQLNAIAPVAGTFAYTPAAGTLLNAGSGQLLSVTFTPADAANYTTATATVAINVARATPTIAWSNPAGISYGTPLGATQLNAAAPVAGTFAYSPAAGTILNAGNGQALSATFTPADAANYTTATATVAIDVAKAMPSLSWSNPASITYGTPLGAAQLNATASVAGTFAYSPAAGTVLNAGNGQTLSVTFTPADAVNYTTATATVQIDVAKATPTLSWTNPAGISYGTPLSGAQLNAVASAAGTFTYTPVAGTVLNAGNGQTLSVTFTPGDAVNYTTAAATLTIDVARAMPSVSWTNPADISYGTPLSATQLNATASVAGTFAYTPAAGTLLNAGSGQLLSVTFTPADAANYTTATATVAINVARATPTISWSNPAGISYGTPLGATQLNAAAPVAGTFAYSPAAGTVLNAGNGQTLSATFTPADAANYTTATATVAIDVAKAIPAVSWSTPATITYGTPLGAAQLNAFASVPGTYTYTPATGIILNAGNGQALSVTFTPADAANYTIATASVQISVARQTPPIVWGTPGDISYGTALDGAHLNATTGVPGSFVYTPAAGTILNAGAGQTLSVTFTPDDAANYTTATASAQIDVTRRSPTITWSNPVDIVHGTVLGAAQLNAAASVAGTFAYAPAAGTRLNAGAGQTLNVTFTPDDAANYTTATASVQINVAKATPVVSWSTPGDIGYGTVLGAAQLNAVAPVAGTFAYAPAAGTRLNAGTGQTLGVTFTPDDAANYTTATASVQINVSKATPVLSWSTPATITYGTPLGATQLNATAGIPGAFAYTPAAGIVLDGGDNQTLSVTFTPDDVANYTTATATVRIDVVRATPVITWSSPAAIGYGTALDAMQQNAAAGIPGTFAYAPPAGTLLNAGDHLLSVTFTPADATRYTTASATVQIRVNKATPVIIWPAPADIYYGTALGTEQLNALAAGNIPGTFAYYPAAGTVPEAGTGMNLSVTFSPTDAFNYTTAYKIVQITIRPGVPVPAGEGVSVAPTRTVRLTFTTVTAAGDATADPMSDVTAPAGSKVVTGSAHDVATTATYAGPVTVCLKYTPSALVNQAYEPYLRLRMLNGSAWDDITTSVDTDAQEVCGVTSSFSSFIVAEPDIVPSCGPIASITVPASNSTGSFRAAWGLSTIAGVTYVLEASKDGGAYTQVYSGPTNSTNVNILENGVYTFRVKATNLGYLDSPWKVSGNVAVTLVCGTPATITVPASNSTGSFKINWGLSNVYGVTYLLESSLNGGSWTTVYSGPSSYANLTIMTDGSYTFRVKATKPGYADSGWTTSGSVAVALVCGTPATISVPSGNSTGSFQATWGLSNLTGVTYVLESSRDGGAYTQIYSGSSAYANITILTDGAYIFRVKATKAGYADSPWKYSGSVAVFLVCGTPASFTVPASNSTGTFQATWTSSNVPGVTYILESSKDGGVYTRIYSGTGTSATVTDLTDGSYLFRVKATKAGFADSPWKTSAGVSVALVCGMPSTITVPPANSTGSIPVSWTASDVTGVTYLLEYSTNGGATYTSAYSGPSSSVTVTAPADGTYLFRVKATRAGYVDSAWKSSASVAVVLVCGTPATITVPGSNSTGIFEAAWGSSTVTGVTYVLEWSLNGGPWTAAYSGPATSATVTVVADGTYILRVKAIRAGFADSAWKTSTGVTAGLVCGMPSSITVPPTNSTGTVPINWKASDVTGVTYQLEYTTNGGATYTTAYSGPSISVNVIAPIDGNYLYRVKATRPGYADSPWKSSATVAVSLVCGAPASISVPSSNSTGSFQATWGISTVTGVTYVLESSRDGGAYTEIYSGSNTYATVTILTDGAYVFRIKATRPNYTDSTWKYSGSVAVTLACGAPGSISVPSSTTTGSFQPTWGASNVAGVTYVLEASRNGGDYQPVFSGTSLYASVTLTDSGTYVLRVKATKPGYADSAWKYSGSLAAALACGAPATITVPASTSTGSIYVSWSSSNIAGVTYVLEASKDGGAYSEVHRGTGLSATVTGLAGGTWTLRVKATKAGFADSAWKTSANITVH